jgi:hypothetical protein
VLSREACPGNSIISQRTEDLILPNLLTLLESDGLAAHRFAARARRTSEQADLRLRALGGRIADVEEQRNRLLDKWLAKEVPDDLYDSRMPELETAVQRLRAERDRLTAQTTLSNAALRRLKRDLLTAGPLTAERWFRFPAARRNAFLKFAFPHGLYVLPPSPTGRRGRVDGRIALRSASDALDAEQRRLAQG